MPSCLCSFCFCNNRCFVGGIGKCTITGFVDYLIILGSIWFCNAQAVENYQLLLVLDSLNSSCRTILQLHNAADKKSYCLHSSCLVSYPDFTWRYVLLGRKILFSPVSFKSQKDRSLISLFNSVAFQDNYNLLLLLSEKLLTSQRNFKSCSCGLNNTQVNLKGI